MLNRDYWCELHGGPRKECEYLQQPDKQKPVVSEREQGRREMAREAADRMLGKRIKAQRASKAFDVADFAEDLRSYAEDGRWP